jgi:putative redox protein
MEMIIDFPGGARVDAHFGPYTVATDQPASGGGDGSAPTPFAVFLASMGTCAGIYVLGFCRQRGLSTDGIRIVQRMHSNPFTGMVSQVDLEIQVPPTFPGEIPPFAGEIGRTVRGEEALRTAACVRDNHERSRTRLIQFDCSGLLQQRHRESVLGISVSLWLISFQAIDLPVLKCPEP